MLFQKCVCVSKTTWLAFETPKSVFNIHSVWFQNNMLGSMWSQNYMGMWIWYFACFYLTRQLELIPPEFGLAGVVLVFLKPHVFNLTGQLESKPPEFPTLALTDLPPIIFGVQYRRLTPSPNLTCRVQIQVGFATLWTWIASYEIYTQLASLGVL